MTEKTPLFAQICVPSDAFKNLDEVFYFLSKNYLFLRNHLFLKNYITSEGAVSHDVLYYQKLSIAHYQVSFYANNYFA